MVRYTTREALRVRRWWLERQIDVQEARMRYWRRREIEENEARGQALNKTMRKIAHIERELETLNEERDAIDLAIEDCQLRFAL